MQWQTQEKSAANTFAGFNNDGSSELVDNIFTHHIHPYTAPGKVGDDGAGAKAG
ncbi:hypothetical protein GALL_403400 [mine drainage metagenome]|uniref:Uncharacterized protein n=1 Tax=mine drainage metagenome TaxID=410659 RepID=A0A1J5QD93_9ZZZZ